MAVDGKVNFEVDDGTFIGQRENCEICNEREHDGYCSQCELYNCQICFDKHLKSKSCRDHVLHQDWHENNIQDSAIRFGTCEEHKQQEVKAYCTEHKSCVCIECILLRHKSCEWEYIIEASNRFQNSGDLARLLEEVQGLEYTLVKCVEALDKHTKTAETINKDCISNIESFTKSLVEYVAGSKQQLLDDVKVRESAHYHKLDKLKVDIQSLGSQVEEIITNMRDEDMLHKRFIMAVETMHKVARIQNEIAAIDCKNAITDYTFRPSDFLKRMMSNTRPIGRLTDASHIEDDKEDEEDIGIKKEREIIKGLEQQLEENQNVISKLNKDLADTKQNYDGRISKLKQELDAMKQNFPTVILPCGHENFVVHFGENRLITCRTCGIINGDQPNGTFSTNDGQRKIELTFAFPKGTQSKLNRSPGRLYSGKTVTCYLVNNTKGKIILKMMNIAFQRKCVFTVDNHGNITNGIELFRSTSTRLFQTSDMPYREYMDRVRQQLEKRGIKESDVTQ